MTEYFKIGQKVFTGPQPEAPIIEPATVTAPAKFGEPAPRPTGTVRGIQDLEPPVAYLIARDEWCGGGVEWLPVDVLEEVTTEAVTA